VKKLTLATMVLLALILSFSSTLVSATPTEKWVKYKPDTLDIDLQPTQGLVTVSITFPDSGYRVDSWGDLKVQKDNNYSAKVSLSKWTGTVVPEITIVEHTYLVSDSYLFELLVRGKQIANCQYPDTTE